MADFSSTTNRQQRSRSRGQANTGCAVVIFALFFLVGCAFLVGFAWTVIWPKWKTNHRFVETTCIVLDKSVARSGSSRRSHYRPDIAITYTVGDRDYEIRTYEVAGSFDHNKADAEEIVERFTVGQRYPCWYDPDDPGKAVLVRGYRLYDLFGLIPVIHVTAGGLGLYYLLCRRTTSLPGMANRRGTSRHGTAGDEERGRVPAEPSDSGSP